jgi:16S rRNA U1498 N3-methylase RsmE
MTLTGPGVTVRMNEEILRATTAAFIAATDKVDEAEHPTIN